MGDARSAPCFIENEPNSVLNDTSLDLADQYQSDTGVKLSQHHHAAITSSGNTATSLKLIVLITNDVRRLAPVMKKSKMITLIPGQELAKILSGSHQQQERNFLKVLLTKNVQVCIDADSLKNEEYVECLRKLLEARKAMFGEKYESVVASALKIKALMLDGPVSLPECLSEFSEVPLIRGLKLENLAHFIESRERERYKTVRTIVEMADVGPRQYISIEPRVPGMQNEQYLDKSYEALLEVFEDAGSYPRQQLLQLLHLPNVQTVRSLCDRSRLQVCIEIQPNSLEDYLDLLSFYQRGDFSSMIASNLRVNNQPYVGIVESTLDWQQVVHVLKYFNQSAVRRHGALLNQLPDVGALIQLVDVMRREALAAVREAGRVHTLGQMSAAVIYVAFLRRLDLSPFEYVRFVHGGGCPDYLTTLRSWDGYNALHLAVKHERVDHLKMMFYTNRWARLNNDVVKPTNRTLECLHVGYTPRRLAEALSFRTSGYDVLLKFDEYNRYLRHMPAVHKACLLGSLQFCSVLVETEPQLIDRLDEYHASCLHYASGSGSAELVDYLLLKGASRKIRNRDGETALHVAAMCGHTAVLEAFSAHFFDIRGPVDKHGYRAVHDAVQYGELDVVRLYADKGFRIDGSLLTAAAKHRQHAVFDFILDRISDVNQGRDEDGRLAIHYSVMNGAESEVSRLIGKGARLELVDKYGRNVFHHAAQHGRASVAAMLVEEARRRNCLQELSARDVFTGSDLLIVVRGKDRGRKAWHWVQLKRLSTRAFYKAMKSGQVDVVHYGTILVSGFGTGPDKKSRQLMKKRSGDILRERKPDMTALTLAAYKNHADVVAVLLEGGADPNARDHNGATAMHFAAMNDNVRMMRLLSDAGSLTDLETDDGKTPHQIAEENGNQQAVNYLLAEEPIRKAREFRGVLTEYMKLLHLDRLRQERKAGQDVKNHLVYSLRSLDVDLNQLLESLDSGPITSAKSE